MPDLYRASPNVLTLGDVIDAPDGFRYRVIGVPTGADLSGYRYELVGTAAVEQTLDLLFASEPREDDRQ
jgi:hypothetical protein